MKKIIISIILITIATVLVFYFWGIPNISGISSADWTDVELIKNRHPFHLINPANISPKDGDIIFVWCIAEMKARLIFISTIWAISIIIVIIAIKKR